MHLNWFHDSISHGLYFRETPLCAIITVGRRWETLTWLLTTLPAKIIANGTPNILENSGRLNRRVTLLALVPLKLMLPFLSEDREALTALLAQTSTPSNFPLWTNCFWA